MYNITAVGWALRHPGINDFKKFISSNDSLNIKGIIFPVKEVENIDGFPILTVADFKPDAAAVDYVVCCARDRVYPIKPITELNAKGVNVVMLNEFLQDIIELDVDDQLNFEFVNVRSSDIRNLSKTNEFSFSFVDIKSLQVYQHLRYALSSSDWAVIHEHDYCHTVHYSILEILSSWASFSGARISFYLDSNHDVYLDVILRMRALQNIHTEQSIEVVIASDDPFRFGWKYKKYERLLQNSLVKEASAGHLVMRLGSDEFYTDMRINISGENITAIMSSSVVGINQIVEKIGSKVKVVLRQPDTIYRNLIALFTQTANDMGLVDFRSSFAKPFSELQHGA